jgi:L-lactate dehydrogenase complex protein LldG
MPAPVEDPNKAAFLERVRESLGRHSPILAMPDHPTLKATLPRHEEKVRTILGKTDARRTTNIAMLVKHATEASWNVHQAKSNADAARVVGDIVAKSGARNIVRTGDDLFKRVDVDGALRNHGGPPVVLASGRSLPRQELKRLAFGSELGICGVEYAIAETASCVVIPRRGVARIASLAPPKLVVLVDQSQVLETLDDFFALMRFGFLTQRARTPNYYNFISGPSRTADIEQTLTIGVHGPGEVHMVIITGS